MVTSCEVKTKRTGNFNNQGQDSTRYFPGMLLQISSRKQCKITDVSLNAVEDGKRKVKQCSKKYA